MLYRMRPVIGPACCPGYSPVEDAALAEGLRLAGEGFGGAGCGDGGGGGGSGGGGGTLLWGSGRCSLSRSLRSRLTGALLNGLGREAKSVQHIGCAVSPLYRMCPSPTLG